MAKPLLMPGDTLGKYEIVRELAIGGMAAIYLARVHGTAGFEKNVVLKCILPNLASDKALVTMFLDEARLAATLRHSNIADVFDVGTEDKRYYFAMEYVHGENARTVRIEAKQKVLPIPLEVSLAITLGTTSALAYAHDKLGPEGPLDLIHRDISPSNIMVSFEGAIKLVDFGIARASMRSGAKTRTGMRKGKVPYMSPEQCRGQEIDRRTDLFSLGTVLYELTTGQRPFRGNSDFEVMDAIVTCEPEPPSLVIKSYPVELEAIVMRLLARVKEARYQTADQLLQDLEQFATRRGMLTSAHAVARYMRELFAAAQDLDRDTYTDLKAGVSGARTRDYHDDERPNETAERVPGDEEPTAAFSRQQQMAPPDLKIKIRSPRASTPPNVHGDEVSHVTPFGDQTAADLVPPFDPIDARSAEILDEIDHDAPANETPDARGYRRVEALMNQAIAWLAVGEADKAVTALELGLDESAHSERAQRYLQRHVDTIVEVYEAMLEDPYRVFVLTRPIGELVRVPMEDGALELLPWVDGVATIREIIERSRMQRLEVYHHLCQMLLRGLLR